MSHVDEGRLHAFLDGALSAADPADAERVELHLASCADCRAKLEEAAHLRDAAAALLGAAAPTAFEMPAFDAIRARADAIAVAEGPRATPTGGRPADVRARRPWQRTVFASPFNGFAWAATIVLAVGLGWLLHDTVEDDARVPITTMDPSRMGGSERGLPPESGAPAPAELTDTDAGGGAEPPVAASSTAEQRAGGTASASAPRAQAAEPAANDGAADAGPERRRTEESLEANRADADPRRTVVSPAPPPPPPAAPSVVLDEPAPTRRADYGVAMDQAAGVGESDALEFQAIFPWQPVSVEEARRLVGGELAVPEGARVISAARGAGPDVEVRTVQQTGRGELVTVIQRKPIPIVVPEDRRAEAERPAAAQAESRAAAAPPAEPGPSATVRWRGWTVTISGQLDSDRLDEMIEDLPR